MDRAGSTRWVLLLAVALGLAVLAAYHDSLAGPFVLDDLSSVAGNPTIRGLWPLTGPLSPPSGGGLTVSGRPLLNLSLALNYASGGLRVEGYHATNLAVHLLAALTLFGILRRTFRRFEPSPLAAAAPGLAGCAALLWALHPLQTESVTYVVQRAESLMGLFYLLTLYCSIRGSEDAAAGPARRLWLAGAVLACAAGMATKEVMVSAPVLVLLYDRTFVAGGFRAAWRRRRAFYLSLAATWILLGALVVRTGDRGGTSGFDVGVAAPTYWLTQGAAVARYLRLAIWPHPLVFDYGLSGAESAARIWPGLVLLVFLIGGTGWALWRRPWLGFLGFWFLAILAPTSLVPGNRQIMAEHRMYLALAPVLTLAVLGVYRAAGNRGLALCLLPAVIFLLLTARRNQDYRSELALYADNVARCPGNAFAQCNLGTVLSALGRVPEAEACFRAALRLRPNYPIAEDNLGNALLRQGHADAAVDHYRAALRWEPGFAAAHDNLGSALLRQGRGPEAIGQYREALRLEPGRAEAHSNLGNALIREGRTAEAIGEYEAALRLDPAYAEADNNLGNALAAAGRIPEAIQRYARALQLRPDYAEAHYNLGNVLLQFGRLDEAGAAFQAAIRLEAGYGPAHQNLGNVRFRQGRINEAMAEYQAALRFGPDLAVTHYNLGNALLRLDRKGDAAAELAAALRLEPNFSPARALLAQLQP